MKLNDEVPVNYSAEMCSSPHSLRFRKGDTLHGEDGRQGKERQGEVVDKEGGTMRGMALIRTHL